MRVTIERSAFLKALTHVQSVVERRNTIPILSNILLEADGDRLLLTATDLELGVRSSCAAKVKKKGAGTIPARRLLDYVRLLPEGEVQVKILENQWASLSFRDNPVADCSHTAADLGPAPAREQQSIRRRGPCWRSGCSG